MAYPITNRTKSGTFAGKTQPQSEVKGAGVFITKTAGQEHTPRTAAVGADATNHLYNPVKAAGHKMDPDMTHFISSGIAPHKNNPVHKQAGNAYHPPAPPTGRSNIASTNARGRGTTPVTAGASPISHVTPHGEFLTPSVYSRGNPNIDGNITGKTVPQTIRPNLIQKIVPTSNGAAVRSTRVGMVSNARQMHQIPHGSDILMVTRQDSPIPSFNSGFNSGASEALSPLSKLFDAINNLFTNNPQATQNQDPNPRLTQRTTSAGA